MPTKTGKALMRFWKKNEGQNYFPCSLCPTSFSRKDNLMKHDREKHSKERNKINEISPLGNVSIQNNILQENEDLVKDHAVDTNDKSVAGLTKEQPMKACLENKSTTLDEKSNGNIWILPAFEDSPYHQKGKAFSCHLCSSSFNNKDKLMKHKQNWHFNRGHPKNGVKEETLKEITAAELELL